MLSNTRQCVMVWSLFGTFYDRLKIDWALMQPFNLTKLRVFSALLFYIPHPVGLAWKLYSRSQEQFLHVLDAYWSHRFMLACVPQLHNIMCKICALRTDKCLMLPNWSWITVERTAVVIGCYYVCCYLCCHINSTCHHFRKMNVLFSCLLFSCMEFMDHRGILT